jgi:YD repeat-containing protein
MPSSEKKIIIGLTAAYDQSSNRRFERQLHNENWSSLYPAGQQDSANRLRQYQRGTLVAPGTSISEEIKLPHADTSRTYNLDNVGNWSSTDYTPVGESPTTETRTTNNLNQLKTRGAATLAYDANGNLLDDGTLTYKYDAFNRLRRVTVKADDRLIAEYFYDAQGRRIRKVTFDPISANNPPPAVNPSGMTSEVQTRYDSLGRVTEDYQVINGNDGYTTNSAFDSLVPVETTLPNDRVLDFDVDPLYRRTAINEPDEDTAIAERTYYGPSRTAELTFRNGIVCTCLNDAKTHSAVQPAVPNPEWGGKNSDRLGYDGAGRNIAKRYMKPKPTA